MYWKTDGIKNRAGLAFVIISNPKRPKIRVEKSGWVQGLTGGFSFTKGKNYGITPQEKDALVKDCQKILKNKGYAQLSYEKADELIQRLKRMIIRVIPNGSSSSIKLNKEYPIDFYEINFGRYDEVETSVIIPLRERTATPKGKVEKAFEKAGIEGEHISELIENLKEQGITTQKKLIEIAQAIITTKSPSK